MDQFLNSIDQVTSLKELEQVRIRFLGRSGIITQCLQDLKHVSGDEKKIKGQEINLIKNEILTKIEQKKNLFDAIEKEHLLKKGKIDITLPVLTTHAYLHPLTCALNRIALYFRNLGFIVKEGPEIEDVFHNFDALNIPEHHPARQSHDTFFLKKDKNLLLRTHTSTVQIRTLQTETLPLRILSTGRVFRHDDLDATHSPQFHQIEGLVIDKSSNMAQLKWIITDFLNYFFEEDNISVRLRPSFFPFTEPSVEVDIAYRKDKDKLILGSGENWMELLGCGMVHPNVLKQTNHDPKIYQGFAFGMGLERLVMLKQGISDIRSFYENDIRWCDYYGGV